MGGLKHSEVRWYCNLKGRPKKAGSRSLEDVVLQDRFVKAFETGMSVDGYNIFVADFDYESAEEMITSLIKRYDEKPSPGDMVCLNNLTNPYNPIIVTLPKGSAAQLKKDLDELRKYPASLHQELAEEINESLTRDFSRIRELADREGMRIVMIDPNNYKYVPKTKGLSRKEEKMFDAKAQAFSERHTSKFVERMEKKKFGGKTFEKFVLTETEKRMKSKIDALKSKYAFSAKLVNCLEAFEADLFSESPARNEEDDDEKAPSIGVNIFVDNSKLTRAPIIPVNDCSHDNVVGKVCEKLTITSDEDENFMKIVAGAMVKGNGGYVILNLEDLLRHHTGEFTYNAIIMALETGKLKIRNPYSFFGESVDPEEIDVDVKVILTGSEELYRNLCDADDRFKNLFKVHADFRRIVKNTAVNQRKYASYLVSFAKEKSLLPLKISGCEALIEYAAEKVESQHRLSSDIDELTDLLVEADVIARKEGKKCIRRADIETAAKNKFERNALNYTKTKEFIDNYSLVSVKGRKVGQINGLAVNDWGDIEYGFPERISASVGVGDDGIIYPDVEAELAGEILTKSVHIINGYLTGKYCRDKPLRISATATFEQANNYSDGDSASSTTVYALLSELSKVPIKQNIAVTGSVDRYGNVQVIGGVNAKIAGFYDVCKMKGKLTGEQGVMIPQKNVQELMLRQDIAESVQKGEFHIYPVKTIDEGLKVLTDKSAKEIHERVDAEIYRLAMAYEKFGKKKGRSS